MSRATDSPTASQRQDLLDTYKEALEAVRGRVCVRRYLQSSAWNRARERPRAVHVAAVGKAAADMMAGAHDILGAQLSSALIITKRGHGYVSLPDDIPVNCVESSHPLPDETSLKAGACLLESIYSAATDGKLLFLISGGASSLVEVLPQGITLQQLNHANDWLLGSGLAIGPVNRIRKRISCIKGGRLASYVHGRSTLNLLISDVPDDDTKIIGSGLLIPHTQADLDTSGLALPQWLDSVLEQSPPLAESRHFESIQTEIVGRSALAREAAANAARQRKYHVDLRDTLLQGDAVETGRRIAREVIAGRPGMTIWSGEPTVQLPPQPGQGGRCQSLALSAALEMDGHEGIWLLAAGTDGTDGPSDMAGALVDRDTVARGRATGLDPVRALAAADAGTFLARSRDLIWTGPTGTNVMDLVLGLKLP